MSDDRWRYKVTLSDEIRRHSSFAFGATREVALESAVRLWRESFGDTPWTREQTKNLRE